ncbi:MAG: DUF1254 domain-containing protein [Comamonadaceae bacterium]|nr:DUF1254 domain-containing protein [Comamonadaceae bacterium]
MRVPPRALGPVDDADFRWVTDVGLTGPDKGAGGDYLFVPPGYQGAVPATGYQRRQAAHQPAADLLSRVRREGRSRGGGGRRQGEGRACSRCLGPRTPPATSFVNLSGVKFNTISANDFSFYEELNAVVQNEPADWVDPDTVGLYAAIGIRKGQPFAPDARMKRIADGGGGGRQCALPARNAVRLARSAARGSSTDRQWVTPFVGGSYQFLDGRGATARRARRCSSTTPRASRRP